MQYCDSIFKTKKRNTRVVWVGNVGIGGSNPVRIQSMTTSCTRDVDATVDQVMKLADAGCEIVRVTVQGIKEAESCELIKNKLVQRGYLTPLVADIHFYPPAAMKVIDFVDKVRINPGNFVDKRASFKVLDYDDASYFEEILKIEEKFTPLVLKCKNLKKAMRIGTNHGSLSDRIMNRFGDTPKGMVESALEFARVCRANDYHDFVFSMKASNPLVMVQAYRLLAHEMNQLGWDYPLHLGVTEAGEGEDGRIKSAMGIGALLLDGLGDTIRISLTEDPWYEIDPCKRLIEFAKSYEGKGVEPFDDLLTQSILPKKSEIRFPKNISFHRDGTVVVKAEKNAIESSDFYSSIGAKVQLGKPKIDASTVDLLMIESDLFNNKKIKDLKEIGISSLPFDDLDSNIMYIQDENWSSIEEKKPELIILSPKDNRLHFCRKFFNWFHSKSMNCPVILHFTYNVSKEDLIIHASSEIGALLCDGLGDGIWLEGPYDIQVLRTLSFNILQAARKRTFKTEFISCPSCGRTLFNIQDVAKRIQNKTAHLPGVKIAIMGCIVNGPGEMADADFGYVGSKPGKIDLYVGKECVERDIDGDVADERLIDLIKRHGRWKDPEQTSNDGASCVS